MQNPPILRDGLENADLFPMSGPASWCFLIPKRFCKEVSTHSKKKTPFVGASQHSTTFNLHLTISIPRLIRQKTQLSLTLSIYIQVAYVFWMGAFLHCSLPMRTWLILYSIKINSVSRHRNTETFRCSTDHPSLSSYKHAYK